MILRSHRILEVPMRRWERHLISVLEDVGEGRIKAMDEVGVDVQVPSHGAPSTQRMDAESGARVAKAANDRLYKIVRNHPDRFAAFANLRTSDPIAAADELERSIEKLGFKGAMIHGLIGEGRVFIDDKQFWPIFHMFSSIKCSRFCVTHRGY